MVTVKYLFATALKPEVESELFRSIYQTLRGRKNLGLSVAHEIGVFLDNEVPLTPYTDIIDSLSQRYQLHHLDDFHLWSLSVKLRTALQAQENPELAAKFKKGKKTLIETAYGSSGKGFMPFGGSEQGTAAVTLTYFGAGFELAEQKTNAEIKKYFEENTRARVEHIYQNIATMFDKKDNLDAILVDIELAQGLKERLRPERQFVFR